MLLRGLYIAVRPRQFRAFVSTHIGIFCQPMPLMIVEFHIEQYNNESGVLIGGVI